MKIYISGKMSGCENNNFEAFHDAEANLKHEGYNVISPARKTKRKTYKEFLKGDIEDLFTCDAIYMLEGWETSNGARAEHAIAVAIGLEIKYEG